MKKVTAQATLKNGKMEFISRKVFANEVSCLPDGTYEVVVRRMGKLRSTPQNNYYWGVVMVRIADALTDRWGFPVTPRKASDALAEQFIPIETIDVLTGESKVEGQSTSELSTSEFTVYIEQCRAFAASDLGIYIEDPDPLYMDKPVGSKRKAQISANV